MGYTQWILAQHSDLTFRFVADSRYGNFHAARATLPQVEPGEVRIVELVLHLEEHAASEVIFVEYRRFPVLASGRRDPNAEMWSRENRRYSATPGTPLVCSCRARQP